MEFTNRSKHSLEQLLKIAKENKEQIKDSSEMENSSLNEAQRFVIFFNVKEGKNKVFASIIYDAYERWSPHPISKLSFFHQFGNLFQRNRTATKSYYLLNYKGIQLIKKADEMKVVKED